MARLLEIEDLSIEFGTFRGTLRAVSNVSLAVEAGESLGLVGESGCGKSTLAYGLMRLLPGNGRFASGRIAIDGTEMVEASEDQVRRVRWQDIAMVFQNAMTALNPVLRIGDQIVNALREHQAVSRAEALDRARAIFETVGLSPARIMNYPHEFSGGMKQRVMMALALICRPRLLLADEPTTALDVVAQRQVLDLLLRLKSEFGLSLILISHDISAVAETCERVAVMYAGEIVEEGPTREVLLAPRHPYTHGLVASIPSLYSDSKELTSIDGTPPNLIAPPPACRFAARCSFAQAICHEAKPPMVAVGVNRRSRCHFAADLPALIAGKGDALVPA